MNDFTLWGEKAQHALAERGRPLTPTPAAARLQTMVLPNGRFLLVLDDWAGDPDEVAVDDVREYAGAAGVLVFTERVDVASWIDDDLAAAGAEACAMTHGEDDDALIGQVRSSFAGLHAEAEAWRMQGRPAVERVAELEAALRAIKKAADNPARIPLGTVHEVQELAANALKDAA